MKTAYAKLLKCPRLLAEKNANHQFCMTTKCMAWVVTECQIDKEHEGYCTEYGKESENKHYYTSIQDIPRITVAD